MTTGTESDWLQADEEHRRKTKQRIVSGTVLVTAGTPKLSSKDTKATFEVCLDYRGIKTTQNGKPIHVTPWLRNLVEMQKHAGAWLVSNERGWDGKVDSTCPSKI
jgi:hypothetical protein